MRTSRCALGVVLMGSAIAVTSHAQGVLSTIVGPAGGHIRSLGWVADVDGDGIRDFVTVDVAGFISSVDLHSGRTGELIHQFQEPPGSGCFGVVVAGQGDVSGDGVPDIIIGAPCLPDIAKGMAYLYSGADFSLIRTHTGADGMKLGSFVAILGDMNGDGGAEYAITSDAYNPYFELELGSVDVFSGLDGQHLVTLPGNYNTGFGSSVMGLGDVSGDGVPDFAVGEPGASSGDFLNNGAVRIHAGGTWGEWTSVLGPNDYALIGRVLDPLGDVDDDGLDDFVTTTYDQAHFVSGALVCSAATGAVLTQALGDFQVSLPVYPSVAGISDVDGDGKDDVLFNDRDEFHGHIITVGSVSGQRLFVTEDPSPLRGDFPTTVASLGDTNDDGFPEFITGDPWVSPPGGENNGTVWVLTMKPLLASPATLATSAPGPVEFTLSPGVGHAGATYLLLASTTPEGSACGGFDVGTAHVPYCFDAVMAASLLLIDSPLLQGSTGMLDRDTGQGGAKLDASGVHLPASAVGLVIDFFYLTRPPGEAWDQAWPPASVEIVP